MLKTRSGLVGRKFTVSTKGNIEKIDESNVIDKTGIINNANIGTLQSGTGFFILGAGLAFIKLRHVCGIATIVHHLDLQSHISIEINRSNYAIRRFFQLTFNGLVQCHPVIFFLK